MDTLTKHSLITIETLTKIFWDYQTHINKLPLSWRPLFLDAVFQTRYFVCLTDGSSLILFRQYNTETFQKFNHANAVKAP